jgi:hypothetical protein
LTIVAIALFAGLLTFRWLATMWTDYLWYDSLDRASVWSTLVFTRVWLVVVAAAVAFVMFLVNLIIVDRLSPRLGLGAGSPDEEILERFQMWVEPRAGRFRVAVSAFFGILIGLGGAAWWENWLMFRHGGSFGSTDPIFGHDIGLYVFKLPFYRDLFGWGFQLVLVLTLVVAAAHYLNGGIAVQGPRRTSPGVKAHVSILLAILALLKAFGYQLDKWELLYSGRGFVLGASYTDVNAQIPALNLLIIISVVAAVILLINLRFRGWTLPLVAVGLWLFTSIVVGGIYPAAIQRFSVQPDELNKEIEYVAYNIEATRAAYDLADVQVRPFAADRDLSASDIEINAPTIDNIRLWDPGVLRTTYQQLQEIRTFYGIQDVDVDRYVVDGEVTQVMISARELEESEVPGGGWVNERLVFTHGFGAVVSPANNVTSEGEPAFLVRDIPPQNLTADPSLDIVQPRIYFSDTAGSDFRIVGSREEEVDYPVGSSDVTTNTYDGEGGVAIGGFLTRAAWALRFGDLDTLISGQVDSSSVVLIERNIKSRIARLAPFLHADADPYLVVVDGGLKWIQDLYTISAQYPYSEFADTSRLNAGPGLPDRFNYIRNSVKAVVDAYDGNVDLYVIDPDDPIIAANQRIFPDVFRDGSELPEEIREHLRYPEDLFRVQTDMYRLYHVTDSRVFFNTSDPWQIARDPSTSFRPDLRRQFQDESGNTYNPMLPYYLLMELPGDSDVSFLLMQPFTPRNRPNMVSFMVAKSGPTLEEYGEMIDFSLPADIQIDGPGQIGDFINQDPQIAAEFTLLDQQGSELIRGNMLVIPIDESLLYVQPVYLTAAGGSASETGIPQFQRVVAAYNRQIEIGDTLEAVLAQLFGTSDDGDGNGDGGPPEPPTGEIPEQITQLLDQAEQAFADAEAALRRGDLAGYATKIAEAEDAVRQATALIRGAEGDEA